MIRLPASAWRQLCVRLSAHLSARLSALLLIPLLGLAASVPARAQATPDPILPVWYAASVDSGAGMAHFSVEFDRAPDLLSVDAFLRQADSFQFWTDTAARDPIASTSDAIQDLVPLGTQAVLTAVDIPSTGQLTYIWPQDASYTGPRDSGGWGQVQGRAGYTLDGNNVLSFNVPLATLHAADGGFAYGFETYQYGNWSGADYFGVSGRQYWIDPVPEPSAPLMLGTGLALLALCGRRRLGVPVAPAQAPRRAPAVR